MNGIDWRKHLPVPVCAEEPGDGELCDKAREQCFCL